MIEIQTQNCTSCHKLGLVPACCWGVRGGDTVRLVILLQQSDFREKEGYLKALLASKTGGLIFRSCEGFLEDVAILNGVKCIHPEDRKRTPSKTIVDNCRKNTFNQIDNISPARIIISGAVALRSLLGESESRFSRGQIFDWNGISALHIGHFGRSATKDELKLTKAFITESRV